MARLSGVGGRPAGQAGCLIPSCPDPEGCEKHCGQYPYEQPFDAITREIVRFENPNSVEHRNDKDTLTLARHLIDDVLPFFGCEHAIRDNETNDYVRLVITAVLTAAWIVPWRILQTHWNVHTFTLTFRSGFPLITCQLTSALS